MKKWICLLVAAAFLGGCGPQKQPVNSVSSESSSISSTSVAEPVELPELTVPLGTGTPCIHHNSRFHILPAPLYKWVEEKGKGSRLKEMMAEVREQKPYDVPVIPRVDQCVVLSVLDVVQELEIPESIFRTSAAPPTRPEGVSEEDWAKHCEKIAFTEAEYGVLFPASTDREAIAAAFQHPLALNILGYLYPLPQACEVYLTEEAGWQMGFHNLVTAVRGIDEEHRPELLPQKETMLKTLREEAQIDKIFSLPNLVGKEAMMGSIVSQTIWLSDHLILQQQRKLVESDLEELVLYDFVAEKVIKRVSEIPGGWLTKWENGFSVQVMNPDPESPRESLYFDLQLNPSTKEAVGEKDEKERRSVDGYSLVYGGENEYKEVLLQAPGGSRKKLFDTGFQEDQYWNFYSTAFCARQFSPLLRNAKRLLRCSGAKASSAGHPGGIYHGGDL